MATAAPAASEIQTIDLDDGQDLDDVPDDFFEDFEKNDFFDGLEVLDDLSPRGERDRRRRSLSGLSSASSNIGLVEKQTHVLNEIKKLERDIAERRRKLCRTRSPIRSPPWRRSLSRHRQSGRTRSRSRGRRNRSRSRDRRSRSRGRPGRSRVELSKRSRRPRPKSRDKVDVAGRKSISFLEELSQKFAEQGKAFPEGEDFDINATNNYDMHPNPFANAVAPFPMYNPMMGPQPPQWLNFNNSNMMGPGPQGMVDPAGMQSMMMQTMDQSSVAMDLESPNSNDRMEAPPPPSIVKREYEEPNARFCDTDEIIRKTFRETVLTRCRDVVNLLKAAETQLVKPPNLYYIPTVISASLPKDTYLSPLQTIHNVDFSFDNDDKAPKYLKRLSQYTSNIVHTLGFNIKTFQFAVQNSSIDDAPLADDAVPAEIKFDIGTQTEPLKCGRCLKNDLREFKDKTTQVAAVTYHIGCQTSNEDAYSFSDMTPAQLVAISDFGKILRGSLMPTNYREATDLRDRLFNIYQTCTGLNKNAFLRDNENRINPAIFRDINDRHPEPVIEERMVQSDMMRQQDRFDNRQMNIEPQRQFEPSRIDRSDQTFSRPSDLFQSNNMFNSSMNSQDRFMQSNERFDTNMQQSDQFNMMRNSDPRCIPQQQMQRSNDFVPNRMSDSMNMSSNRFDSNQDRFSNMSMNLQQQQPNNMWGQASGGPLSSLSPISNNSRGGQNDDFARRSAPQPQSVFPETASGVMTCKQIMEMERGRNTQPMNQQNNMQFENSSAGRNMGGVAGGGRGNRGGAQNRNQPQNRSNRGGSGNRF